MTLLFKSLQGRTPSQCFQTGNSLAGFSDFRSLWYNLFRNATIYLFMALGRSKKYTQVYCIVFCSYACCSDTIPHSSSVNGIRTCSSSCCVCRHWGGKVCKSDFSQFSELELAAYVESELALCCVLAHQECCSTVEHSLLSLVAWSYTAAILVVQTVISFIQL